jgi:hypothetical protein
MTIPQCFTCIHVYRHNPRGVFTCDAFPAGIPQPILTGDADHTQPYEGDQGIRYQRDPATIPAPDAVPDLSDFDDL